MTVGPSKLGPYDQPAMTVGPNKLGPYDQTMIDCPRAYAACEAMARAHYENFPVASRLLPAAMRPHVAAVYAYARVADDIADEGSAPAADRLARLEAWQQRLHAAVAASEHGFDAASPAPEDLMMMALAHS